MSDTKDKEVSFLKQSLVDISRGYSRIVFQNKTFYIKHITFQENLLIDSYQSDLDELAIKQKIPSELERLEFLARKKLWSDLDERNLNDQKIMLSGLEHNKTKCYISSQLEYMENTINSTKKNINELWSKRYFALDITKERFTEERLNRFLIYNTLYSDIHLKNLVFESFEEFENQDDIELSLLTILYNEELVKSGVSNIKKIVVSDFFAPYFIIYSDNINNIFKDVINNGPLSITYNQIHFIINFRHFKHVFETNKIPQNIRNNPERIEEYVLLSANAKEIMDRNSDKGNYMAVMGNSKDMSHFKELGGKGAENDKLMTAMKNKPINNIIEAVKIGGF